MPPPRCRPFTVLDAMLLVAATAVGIAVMRYDGIEQFAELGILFDDSITFESYWEMFDQISYAIRGFQPLLLACTIALLVLRLRRPRPPVRRLVRQPGFAAACGVASVSIIDFSGRMSSCFHFPAHGFSWPYWTYFIWYNSTLIESLASRGSAVAAVWTVMALGRAIRPEPSWIDRGGRALGVLWLVLLALEVSISQAD